MRNSKSGSIAAALLLAACSAPSGGEPSVLDGPSTAANPNLNPGAAPVPGGAAGASGATGGSSSGAANGVGGVGGAGGEAPTAPPPAATGGASGGGAPMAGGADPGGGAAGSPNGGAAGSAGTNVSVPARSENNTEFFKLGDLRLINNAWGSAEIGCDSDYSIFVDADKSFGWEFDRGDCKDPDGTKPDYPEVEFGIHPFGENESLITSPDFSSTSLLPLQIKDVTSASVVAAALNMQIANAASWNLNFELWVTEQHPVTGTHMNAYAELMVFWGWQDGRWPCDVPNGSFEPHELTAGDKAYTLCHQSDDWGAGWRYFQFRVKDGPLTSYSGKLDIKRMLEWLVQNAGWSPDLWISRFEIGSEIGDNTSGKVSMKNVTFEVNGESRAPEFGN